MPGKHRPINRRGLAHSRVRSGRNPRHQELARGCLRRSPVTFPSAASSPSRSGTATARRSSSARHAARCCRPLDKLPTTQRTARSAPGRLRAPTPARTVPVWLWRHLSAQRRPSCTFCARNSGGVCHRRHTSDASAETGTAQPPPSRNGCPASFGPRAGPPRALFHVEHAPLPRRAWPISPTLANTGLGTPKPTLVHLMLNA